MGSEQQSCAECQSRKQHKMPSLLVNAAASTVPVALVLLALYFYKFHGGLSGDPAVWGQLGDYIGGLLNPFFSFIALLALLYTIRLQSEEMRNSTAELKHSAQALLTQNNVMLKQSFETSFFNLLGLLSSLVRDSVIDGDVHTTHRGRSCFEMIYTALLKALSSVIHDTDGMVVESSLKSRCGLFFRPLDPVLGHYFRTLYGVLRFVDDSDLSDDQKRLYTRIVRAQLSGPELGLILFNCVGDLGGEKLMPLVIKYNLLKHLDMNSYFLSRFSVFLRVPE
jgi:hypothetical protein